jgi:dihydrodipicolinate synthase/N-acetylneuraminate lyase
MPPARKMPGAITALITCFTPACALDEDAFRRFVVGVRA